MQSIWIGWTGGTNWRVLSSPSHVLPDCPMRTLYRLEICESMRLFIEDVVNVGIRMVLHLILGDCCAHFNDVTAVIVVEGLIAHVALQSAKYIICRPTEGNATNLRGTATYVEKKRDSHIRHRAAKDKTCKEAIEKRNWGKGEGKKPIRK